MGFVLSAMEISWPKSKKNFSIHAVYSIDDLIAKFHTPTGVGNEVVRMLVEIKISKVIKISI